MNNNYGSIAAIEAAPRSWEGIREWIASAPFSAFDSGWVAALVDEFDFDPEFGLKNLALTMIQVRARYRNAGMNPERTPDSPSLEHDSCKHQILEILSASPVPMTVNEIRAALPKYRMQASTVCATIAEIKKAGKIRRIARATYEKVR